jgi:thiamine biosynthesis lipoprotein
MLAGGAALLPLVGRTAAERRPGRMERIEAARASLGTWMRVTVRSSDRARAEGAIEAAFAAVRRVDALMSVHRSDSELSRVNAAAGRAAEPVDADLRAVVAIARDAARRSGGVYDPSLLPLMHAYGFYGARVEAPPDARRIDRALANMGWDEIAIDDAAGTLGLGRRGGGLDLGSIGKGWAIDRAVAALRAAGIHSGMVDLGGNVYCLGSPDDEAPGWSVGVFHPVTGKLDRVFVLRDAAVATSSNSEQTRILGTVRIGHLFDARRGSPANGHLSASVVARTGVESDVMSTTAFVLGPDRFRGWPGAVDTHFVG